MKPALDDLATLVGNFGRDPRKVTIVEILAVIQREALMEFGRAAAAVRLDKPPGDVTIDEAVEALEHMKVPGDDDRTARMWRAGEIAVQDRLTERGLYIPMLAFARRTANVDLDNGEVTLLSKPSPTNKRQAGRPSRSQDFMKMVGKEVYFRHASGQASSIEKVLEQMRGVDRHGKLIPGIKSVLEMPRGKTSHSTIVKMLQRAAREAPAVVEEARRQGEIAKAGGEPEAEFMQQLLNDRPRLADKQFVASMLKEERRANRQ